MSVWLLETGWRYEFQYEGKRYSRRGFSTPEAALEAQLGRKYMVQQGIDRLQATDVIDEFSPERVSGSHGKRPISYVIDKNGCHICVSHAGEYPEIKRNGKVIRLSRFIYEQAFGPIPEGMVVMHTCDNPRCINPLHLKLGTHKDNQYDKISKGRGKSWNEPIAPTEASLAWAEEFYGADQ